MALSKEKKEALIKKFFKDIYGVLISAKYQSLSKEEILSVASQATYLFGKRF